MKNNHHPVDKIRVDELNKYYEFKKANIKRPGIRCV
jgi:hypothetical protein